MKLNIFRKKSLVEQAIKGNKEAFENLIRQNKLLMYKVANGILRNEEDIEDAIQETILKAFENIVKLREEKNFNAWLVTILINECKSIFKKNKNITYLEGVREEGRNDLYSPIDIINGINLLENQSKEIMILYYFYDLKSEEISEKIGINHGTVRTKISRGKKKLYEILGEDYIYEQ